MIILICNNNLGCANLIKFINKKFPWFFQFFKFGIIGAFNTFLSVGILDLLYFSGVDKQLANFIAFVISVINAYFWNSKWVFKEKGTYNLSIAKNLFVESKYFKALLYVISHFTIVRFFMLYTSTYLLSAVLLVIWCDKLHIILYIASAISLFITIPINYLMSKFWVFKVKKREL
jgi:putative flippase GtrA